MRIVDWPNFKKEVQTMFDKFMKSVLLVTAILKLVDVIRRTGWF